MATKKLKDMTGKEITAMQNEMLTLMLKRANITKADIVDTAMRKWATANMDLLTSAELKKFAPIL